MIKWLRIAAAVFGSILIWKVIIFGGFIVLQEIWHDYFIAHQSREFSSPMLFVRLCVFVLAVGLISNFATRISGLRYMPFVAAAVIFMLSVPDHLFPGFLWDEFPAWYHLVYLFGVIPLGTVLGHAFVPKQHGNS